MVEHYLQGTRKPNKARRETAQAKRRFWSYRDAGIIQFAVPSASAKYATAEPSIHNGLKYNEG